MRLSLLLLVLAACDTSGTMSFALVHPAGETRLPVDVVSVKLSLDNPPIERTAAVDAEGRFDIVLDFPTDGVIGRLSLQGLDASGVVRAVGRSPALPLDGRTDGFVLFVSPPGEVAVSPLELPAATHQAVGRMSFGALVAGGALAGVDQVGMDVINLYSHSLQPGRDLPMAASGATLLVGDRGLVFLFTDGELLAFDTGAPPAGVYSTLGSYPEWTRRDAPGARLADGRFVIGGSPILLFDPFTGALAAWSQAPAAADGASSATALADGQVLLVGANGGAMIDTLGNAVGLELPRGAHAAVARPGGGAYLVGGLAEDPTAITFVAADGQASLAGRLATARSQAAVALSRDRLLVAGGEDDLGVRADAELFQTDEPLLALPSIALPGPLTGARALTVDNAAILLIGGSDGNAEVDRLLVFQP